MNDAVILLTDAHGRSRQVVLNAYLEPEAEERSLTEAYRWIKSLRSLHVDAVPMRQRFAVRGDSLWWFTELYLHKLRVVLDVHRALAAMQALVGQERPRAIGVQRGTILVRHVAAAFADARRLQLTAGRPRSIEWTLRLARLDARARVLTVSAFLSRTRSSQAPPGAAGRPAVAAFVHRAFWRPDIDDGSAESYIGPVLHALEQRAASVRYVGVGPTDNFRARRWWDPGIGDGAGSRVTPIERFAPLRALAASREVWRNRRQNFQALVRSPALREAAVIHEVDVWPLVKEQLAGIAWLQWPWSVRAMDEAAAALDALSPQSVLTYAEAGGWGRALILEARRRHIPSVGLQHGFIYRHWLNYLHEPDEMIPDDGDQGFPYPTRTLLFDGYTAQHLRQNGRFPDGSLVITGSPQRDGLTRALESLSTETLSLMRARIGAAPDDLIVLLTTKEREARGVLPAVIAAVGRVSGSRLVIKPHPAETVASYQPYVATSRNVIVVPPDFPLAVLLALCRMVVTVNSTVALDAAVLGVPALVVGLPNNLTPLVDAGVLAGAASIEEIEPALERILYDDSFRQQLAARQRAALEIDPTDRARDAAETSAAAILDLVADRQRRDS